MSAIAPLKDIADGVAAALNAAGSGAFTLELPDAVVTYQPAYTLEDIKEDTLFQVVPGPWKAERGERRRHLKEYDVRIGLLYDVRDGSAGGGVDFDKFDDAIATMDDIFDYLRNLIIVTPGGRRTVPIRMVNDPPWDRDSLDADTFMSVLTPVYQVIE